MSTNNTTNNVLRPQVYIDNVEITHEEAPLEINPDEVCPYCAEEITLDQIKHVIETDIDEEFTKNIIDYLNLYREEFNLNTCLRKAHFIAQVGAEMKFKRSNTEEGTNYLYSSLHSTFNKSFPLNHEIDDTILDSLESHLSAIFKITTTDKDKKETTINLSNKEIKEVIKSNKVKANIGELYGRRELDPTVLKKGVMKDSEGKEITINITILERNESFGVETLSRAYANSGGNGDEQSREGYLYRGRGLIQLTHKNNYKEFSEYRRRNPFPQDPLEYVDFTEITNKVDMNGEFDKIANNKDTIYAVQSALWFFNYGNPIGGKFSVEWADKDDIFRVSQTINGGSNGLYDRNNFIKRAREDNGFKVLKHYEWYYEHGTYEQKREVEKRLLNKDSHITETRTRTNGSKYNLVDPNTEALYTELTKPEIITPFTSVLINIKDLKLIPNEK